MQQGLHTYSSKLALALMRSSQLHTSIMIIDLNLSLISTMQLLLCCHLLPFYSYFSLRRGPGYFQASLFAPRCISIDSLQLFWGAIFPLMARNLLSQYPPYLNRLWCRKFWRQLLGTMYFCTMCITVQGKTQRRWPGKVNLRFFGKKKGGKLETCKWEVINLTDIGTENHKIIWLEI